jgi:hypothetical protein
MKKVILFVVACLMICTGCTSSATKTTEKGLFKVRISSEGRLLREGRNEVDITVTDDKGAGVAGAKVEISPWMPEHHHGSMWPPTITERGNGVYRAVIPLIMSGHWELKVKIHRGDVEDSTTFDFPNVIK